MSIWLIRTRVNKLKLFRVGDVFDLAGFKRCVIALFECCEAVAVLCCTRPLLGLFAVVLGVGVPTDLLMRTHQKPTKSE